MTYLRIDNKSNTKGVACGAETAILPDDPSSLSDSRVFVFYEVYCKTLSVLLWIVLSICRRLTASDYIYVVGLHFWLHICRRLTASDCIYVVDLQLLITYMSSTYSFWLHICRRLTASDYIYVVDLQLRITYMSSAYSFWLHICRRLTASDYIYVVDLQLLITYMSSTYSFWLHIWYLQPFRGTIIFKGTVVAMIAWLLDLGKKLTTVVVIVC
jgi:hypothetical protein